MDFIKQAMEVDDYVIGMRRYFHENPELSGVEENTVKRIMDELEKMGIPYINIPNGGILATIDSGKAGRTVALRADIDALPMAENKTNPKGLAKPALSKVEGVCHSCGHDGHTAMLLGAAKLLNGMKESFCGKIMLIFERGEEGGGNFMFILKYMENHGIDYDSVYGTHLSSAVDCGKVAILDGDTMATVFGFNVTIIGRGGHGSRPDMSQSPVDCFVAIYNGMNTIRMRNCDPYNPITFSIGQLNAGTKGNIIPGELTFAGTSRMFSYGQGMCFKEAFINMLDNICKAYGCTYKINSMSGPGIGVYNDPQCAALARNAAEKYLGKDYVVGGLPWLGSESFSFLQRKAPGVFAFVGCKNEEKGITADHHNPDFDIDEDGLKIGVASFMAYALEFLENGFDTEDRKMKGKLSDFLLSIGRPQAVADLIESYKE